MTRSVYNARQKLTKKTGSESIILEGEKEREKRMTFHFGLENHSSSQWVGIQSVNQLKITAAVSEWAFKVWINWNENNFEFYISSLFPSSSLSFECSNFVNISWIHFFKSSSSCWSNHFNRKKEAIEERKRKEKEKRWKKSWLKWLTILLSISFHSFIFLSFSPSLSLFFIYFFFFFWEHLNLDTLCPYILCLYHI